MDEYKKLDPGQGDNLDSRHWQILLVEDDEDDYILTQNMLLEARREHFDLEWVDTYEKGLSALTDKNFDAALVDYHLGGRNGLELVRAAKNAGCNTAFLLLTGQGSYELDVEAMKAGVTDYLVKDEVTPALLERGLRYAVERKVAEQARNRLIAILEATPDLISIASAEGKVLYLNAAAKLVSGISPDHDLPPGSTMEESPIWGSEFIQKQAIVDTLQGGSWRGESRIRGVDGEEFPVSQVILSHTGPDKKVEYLSTIVRDISERKRVEEEMHKNVIRAEILARFSQAFAQAGVEYQEVLQTVSELVAESLGDGCVIRIASEDRRWLETVAFSYSDPAVGAFARQVLVASKERVGLGLAGKVFISGESLLLKDLSLEQLKQLVHKDFWLWPEQTPLKSTVIVPLRAHDRLIGTMSVFSFRQERQYDEDDLYFFQDLANRAGMAIENARLFLAQARRARELDALHSATAALLTTLDLEELVSHILAAAVSAIPVAEQAALYLTDVETGRLRMHALHGYSNNPTQGKTVPRLDGYLAQVINDRRPILVSDLHLHQQQVSDMEIARSLMAVPLMLGKQVLGALSLSSQYKEAFRNEDIRLLISFANTTTTAIQNARLHAEVQRLAETDPLTNVYNRRGFSDAARREIERAKRFNRPLSLIMIDVDHFKDVNDRCGHAAGDEVLRNLAERVRNTVRELDLLGRHGGDEFVVLLPEAEAEVAHNIAERIRDQISKPFQLVNSDCFQTSVEVSASLGVAHLISSDKDLYDLLRRADEAAYQAKRKGRNRVAVL